MICDKCKVNEAHIILKQSGQVENRLCLCEGCAVKHADDNQAATIIDRGHLRSIKALPFKVNEIYQTQCQGCGLTYTTFKQLGRLGCTQCLKAFEKKLMKDLSDLQYDLVHKGQVPKESTGISQKQQRLAALEHALDHAIESENYTLAAQIRDRLKITKEADHD